MSLLRYHLPFTTPLMPTSLVSCFIPLEFIMAILAIAILSVLCLMDPFRYSSACPGMKENERYYHQYSRSFLPCLLSGVNFSLPFLIASSLIISGASLAFLELINLIKDHRSAIINTCYINVPLPGSSLSPSFRDTDELVGGSLHLDVAAVLELDVLHHVSVELHVAVGLL